MRLFMNPCRRSLVAGLGVLSSAVACSSSTAPGPARVEFSASPAADVPWSEHPVSPTVRVSSGRMEVTGVIHTPDPCQDLSAQAVRANRTILLTVTARSRGGGCIAVIGTFRYTAVMADLPVGTYLLKVAHVYPNTGWENSEVLSREVTVP
jgi:hypothetical protein